ncbi:hypothetical protein KY385_03275 [Candidatus Parcubacteria bacterium]|nr:hypothetical protein [Candidatus Parcubacteria bacterium]
MGLVNDIFLELLRATKVSTDALAEARNRRDSVFAAALTYEGAYRTIKSGSIAHGTVSGTISDADGAVVLSRKQYPDYGSDGENKGPRELVEAITDDMRNLVQQNYPNVGVSTNHKRAIYFRFFEPMEDGQDPTVDLVIALNRKDEPGLWIPHLGRNIWQASHPEKHSELVKAKRDATNHISTKVVRISKLYAKQWKTPGLLYSFHLTALMLESLSFGESIAEGFQGLLTHASSTLAKGNTKDPAGVSEPLKLPLSRERDKVIKKLKTAVDHLEAALDLETSDDENFDDIMVKLKKIFWQRDIQEKLEDAAQKALLDRAIARTSTVSNSSKFAVPVASAGLARPVINARAYASSKASTINPVHPATWFEEPETRRMFESGLSGTDFTVLHAGISNGKCIYVVSIPIKAYRTSTLVRIEFNGKSASVYAPGLSGLRHVNPPAPEQSLCLWYPGDGAARKWKFEFGIVPLLELVRLHLYKEMRFKETGRWPGEEVH